MSIAKIVEAEYDGHEPEMGIFAHRREQRISALGSLLSESQLAAYEEAISHAAYHVNTSISRDEGTTGISVAVNPEAY